MGVVVFQWNRARHTHTKARPGRRDVGITIGANSARDPAAERALEFLADGRLDVLLAFLVSLRSSQSLQRRGSHFVSKDISARAFRYNRKECNDQKEACSLPYALHDETIKRPRAAMALNLLITTTQLTLPTVEAVAVTFQTLEFRERTRHTRGELKSSSGGGGARTPHGLRPR